MTEKIFKLSIGTIIFFPPEGVLDLLNSFAETNHSIIIFDNTPGQDTTFVQTEVQKKFGSSYMRSGVNEGLSGGLNQLFATAESNGSTHLLYFDQDTSVNLMSWPKMSEDYLRNLRTTNTAVAAASWKYSVRPTRSARMDVCIASGSVFDLEKVKEVGGADSKLFLDLVDFDLCLRLRSGGFLVSMDFLHPISHSPGVAIHGSRWPHVGGHSMERHRSMAKNSRLLWRRHFRAHPNFVARNIAIRAFEWAAGLLAGPARCEYVKAIFGGLRGR